MAEQTRHSHSAKTVRSRCQRYLSGLEKLGYSNELPRNKAIDLFSQIMDLWDRLTIKAYFGTVAHKSKRQFYQDSQYTSGTISHKTITLSQQVQQSKGYLEKLGLVSFNLKNNCWFMKIEKPILVPQLGIIHGSIQNLSISHIAQSNNFLNEHEKTSESNTDTLENKQQLEDERDKFHNEVTPKLNPLESSILQGASLPKCQLDKSQIDPDDSS